MPTAGQAARSKTVWLGFVITLLGYFQANLPTLKVMLSIHVAPEFLDVVMGWITMGLGFGVVVVRFLTDGPLSAK